MKKIIICSILFLIGSMGVYFYIKSQHIESPLTHDQETNKKEKPLEKYTFENLIKTPAAPSPITLEDVVKETPIYTSQIFHYFVNGKKVSGLINIPAKVGTYPIIVMNRGFVPKNIYFPGNGTQHAGEVFVANGYITLAPDFLGYGTSDNASTVPFEDRFQTYTTELTLLSSLSQLNTALIASKSSILSDPTKVGLWGHSNGGNITLSTLSITGKPYPTVLWAPVSKPFPFSILFFTDEPPDYGKDLRHAVANFEKDYNSADYSPPNFYKRITAPIQIHQGTADTAVPFWWSDDLYKTLKNQDLEITYFTYPGVDHNFIPAVGGWNLAVNRSLEFYNHYLKP